MTERIIIEKLNNWQGRMPDESQLYIAIDSKESMKVFRKQLADMKKNGLIVQTQRGKWAIPERVGLCVGRIQKTQKGFGFLIPLDTTKEDIFIPAHNLNGAMNDDLVMVNIVERQYKGKLKTEGLVCEIIERAKETLVGVLEIIDSGGFVVPDDKKFNQDIYVPRSRINKARDGDKVVVKIIEYPKDKRSPVGEITEILGNANDVGVDILSIIRDLGLRDSFSKEILDEAESLSKDPISADKSRLDLRDLTTFTIDGSDSKDFDDAISIERVNNLWRLGVHIADVSHYVSLGTMLNDEALERGTSVYLIDRVLPMLPETLSNGVCSLNEGVDRYTLSCIMDIDNKGKVKSSRIMKSIISSKARLTYDLVNDVLLSDTAAIKQVKGLEKDLKSMNILAKILGKKREARGSLELNIDEPHIMLDEDGVPVSIKARTRGDSQKLIEEFMLCANETVAKYVFDKNLPFLYRVHEQPDPEKMTEFLRFANNLGFRLGGASESVTPKQLQSVLDQCKGAKGEDVLHRILLRTLQKAKYHPTNLGHYGLASEYYCHFTSPIRRYPDLVVHRVLKAVITGDGEYLEKLNKRSEFLAAHCSKKERSAMEAERNVDDLKMTEYMTKHIGETFEAVISGVKEFGLFVELENTIEGLIHISDLQDDYYTYFEQGYMLKGQRTGVEYKLGDRVNVKCINANIASCKIDFVLHDNTP